MIEKRINSSKDYRDSLKQFYLNLYAFGEKIENVIDHPLFKPHVNAVAATYDLSNDPEFEDLANAKSHLVGKSISRFNHIHQSREDLIKKVKMLRMLNQRTACCIQRCAGMDSANAAYSVTYEIDRKYGTKYHERFKAFQQEVQERNLVVIGAMTDPKGDRSKAPHQQADPDLYLRVVEERKDGIIVRGAKAHLTGVTSAHYVIVFPTSNMRAEDKDYSVCFAMPIDAPGMTYIFGRQTNDLRKMEEGDIDKGNAQYAMVGGECLAIFEDVFVPWERVFMYKEFDFAGLFVERFAAAHRQNYGACKGGISDVLVGACAALAEYNGVANASHIRDKLVEMVHLTETLYSGSIACSSEGHCTPSGAWQTDILLANCTKQNTTRMVYEIGRLAHDIAGGLLATLPSEQDYRHPQLGKFIDKYLKGVSNVPTEHRIRLFRLIEAITGGTAVVESMHGAGPPQTQRVFMLRQANLGHKIKLAKKIAGVKEE